MNALTKQEIIDYIINATGAKPHIIASMMNIDSFNVSTTGDCKVALSNAIQISRLLSGISSVIQGKIAEREITLDDAKRKYKEIIYKYIRELDSGYLPLSDKPLIVEELNRFIEYENNLAREMAAINNESEEITKTTDVCNIDETQNTQCDPNTVETTPKRKGRKKASPRPTDGNSLWNMFRAKGIRSENDIKFTSIDITTITDMPVESKMSTIIRDAASTAALRESQIGQMNVTRVVISKLLEGVQSEIKALNSISQILVAEQYGVGRTSRLD